MPNFQVDNPQFTGAGVSTPRPVSVDTRTADNINLLGGMAIQGTKMAAVADVKNDMNALAQNYLSPEQQIDYTQEELNAVNELGSRLTILQQAEKQKGRTAEFRTRAEALLKEKIAAMPGLAAEFRGAASGVLGFDPTGESLRQQAEALEDAATAAAKQRAAIEKQAVQEYGMAPGEIYTPEGQKKYNYRNAVQQKIFDMEQQQKLLELEAGNTEVNKTRFKQTWFANVEDFTIASAESAQNTLRQGFSDYFGESFNPSTDLTPTTLARIPQAERLAIKAALVQQKRALETRINAQAGAYLTTTELNDQIAKVTSGFDSAISALDSEEAFKKFQAESKLRNTLIQQELAGTEVGQQVLTMQALGLEPTETMKATAFSAVAGSQGVQDVIGIWNNKTQDPAPLKVEKAEEVEGHTADMSKWIQAEKRNIASGQSANPQVGEALINYLDSASQGMSEFKDPKAAGKLLRFVNSTENADYIQNALREEPFVRQELVKGTINHGQKLARTLNTKLSNRTDSIQGGGFLGPEVGSTFSLDVQDGEIVVSQDERAQGNTTLRRSQISGDRQRLRELTNMAGQLNEAAEQTALLTGQDKNKVLGAMLEGTPLESMAEKLMSTNDPKEQGPTEQEQAENDLAARAEAELAQLDGENVVDGFVRDLALLEGTEAHTDQGGLATAPLGVTDRLGLTKKENETDEEFAKRAVQKVEGQVKTKAGEEAYNKASDALKRMALDVTYNVGTGKTPSFWKAFKEGDVQEAAKQTLDIFSAATNTAEGSQDLVTPGLAARRMAFYNAVARETDGMAEIAKATMTPEANGTRVDYLDGEGNVLHTFNTSKKLLAKEQVNGQFTTTTEQRSILPKQVGG